MMSAFPNVAQCLLCSDGLNSIDFPYCSGDTPVTMGFPQIRESVLPRVWCLFTPYLASSGMRIALS